MVAWLEEKGLFRGRAGNAMRLGLCSRSKDVIEPVLKPQWWVACSGMAADACAAVRNGQLQIVPSDFEATWFRCGCCAFSGSFILAHWMESSAKELAIICR